MMVSCITSEWTTSEIASAYPRKSRMRFSFSGGQLRVARVESLADLEKLVSVVRAIAPETINISGDAPKKKKRRKR